MKRALAVIIITIFLAAQCYSFGGNPPEKEGMNMKNQDSQVLIETSKGKITVELDRGLAPVTVDNFLGYVDSGFYDGTIFHRVIKGFMIQGGGLKAGLKEKLTLYPIKNEAGNGLKNTRGTIAMARSTMVDSATSQFFINTVNNDCLDHRDNSQEGFGYCVFGAVVDGMDVVDSISSSPTHSVGYYDDVPVNNIEIMSIKRK